MWPGLRAVFKTTEAHTVVYSHGITHRLLKDRPRPLKKDRRKRRYGRTRRHTSQKMTKLYFEKKDKSYRSTAQ